MVVAECLWICLQQKQNTLRVRLWQMRETSKCSGVVCFLHKIICLIHQITLQMANMNVNWLIEDVLRLEKSEVMPCNESPASLGCTLNPTSTNVAWQTRRRQT